MPQKIDFTMSVLNDTNHDLEFCNSILTFCKKLRPGDYFIDLQATNGKADEWAPQWIAGAVIKACDRVIPLRKLIGEHSKKEGWRGKVDHRVIVSGSNYVRECMPIKVL